MGVLPKRVCGGTWLGGGLMMVRGHLAAGTRLGNTPKVRTRGLEMDLSRWPLHQVLTRKPNSPKVCLSLMGILPPTGALQVEQTSFPSSFSVHRSHSLEDLGGGFLLPVCRRAPLWADERV